MRGSSRRGLAPSRDATVLDSPSALRERTVVVFMSDQGFFLGEHGRTDKRLAYEEALFFPLIVRFPREVPARGPHRPVRAMALNLDIAPTLLEYAGVRGHAIQRAMAGRSLRGVLADAPNAMLGWRTATYFQ